MLGLILPVLASAAAPEVEKAWADLDNSRPRAVFQELDGKLTSPEARLAWASALMSDQPATDGNMRKAEDILNDIAQGRDDTAAEAAYLSGRINQLYYSTPDCAKAAQIYRALADRQPQSHWAQLGLVKLGLIELYAPADPNTAPAVRVAAAEALLPRIHEPFLCRDLELQIGQAGVVLKLPLREVIPHLVAADRVGGFSASAREDLVVQIGELSLRAGEPAQAKAYFERYLREFPGMLREYVVRIRLQEANRLLQQQTAAR